MKFEAIIDCSRSEIKFVGKRHCDRMETKTFSFEPVGKFFAPNKHFYATYPLNEIVPICRSRAIHPKLVGLFFWLRLVALVYLVIF